MATNGKQNGSVAPVKDLEMSPQMTKVETNGSSAPGKDLEMTQPNIKKAAKRHWTPYSGAWTETPFLCCLSRVLPYWYRCRNFLVRNPLITTRLPSIPYVSKAPWYIKYLHHSLTLGELLIIIPAIFLTIYFCVIGLVVHYPQESTVYSGNRASFLLIFVLMFASRNSLLTFLLGVPFERQLFWHKLTAGIFLIFLAWTHGIRALMRDNTEPWDVNTGLGLIAFYTAFPVLSFVLFRRRFFTVFHLVHITLFIGAMAASIPHHALHIFYGLPFWLLDVLFRYVYLSLIRAPKKATITRLPANVVRITFPKGDFKYSPGQYMFVMIPAVNILEWHPFSISSAPHQDFVSCHIRVLGDWTKRLYDVIGEKGGGPLEMTAYFEGAYGAPMIDVESDKYQMLLLISGGIGITPMQSLANSLSYEAEVEGRPLKKVWFVWAAADKYMLGANFEHDDCWRGKHSPPELPLSFQPDTMEGNIHTDENLAEHRVKAWKADDEHVVHTEFYLTRVRTAAELEDANIRPELQPYVKFGRPDMDNIFKTFAAYAESHNVGRIGVMVCGPAPLVDDVRRRCGLRREFQKEPGAGVAFDYHSEIFEF